MLPMVLGGGTVIKLCLLFMVRWVPENYFYHRLYVQLKA